MASLSHLEGDIYCHLPRQFDYGSSVRAARLLDMLLLLQRRGRMTATELAGTLEVSRRSLLRDVEALSEEVCRSSRRGALAAASNCWKDSRHNSPV